MGVVAGAECGAVDAACGRVGVLDVKGCCEGGGSGAIGVTGGDK